MFCLKYLWYATLGRASLDNNTKLLSVLMRIYSLHCWTGVVQFDCSENVRKKLFPLVSNTDTHPMSSIPHKGNCFSMSKMRMEFSD